MSKKTFLTNEDKAELEAMLGTKADKSAIKEVKFSDSCDLLWENASPTSEFGQQTVSIDYSNYTYMAIDFLISSELNMREFFVFPIAETNNNARRSIYRIWHLTCYHRQFYLNNDGVLFATAGSGHIGTLDGADDSGDYRTDNKAIVPLKIWGIK